MSEQISKHKWAAIIYGRSYHLDFRFITLPQDFTEQKKDWAAEYILATLSQANKLSERPRWSLFKDESHCVIGITCMVRDLLQDIISQDGIELLSKDNQGRPLYVFVGYATPLNQHKSLLNFPSYNEQSLQPFHNLYQHILKVWWVEEYCENSKKPFFDEYQTINFEHNKINIEPNVQLERPINDCEKQPHHIYLWQNNLEQNQQLWSSAALCDRPTSVCLGNQKLKHILKSPFLNQTVTQDALEILDNHFIEKTEHSKHQSSNKKKLAQIITNKAKEDLETTLRQARIIKDKSQYLLQNISDRSKERSSLSLSPPHIEKQQLSASDRVIDQNFGFKTKSNEQKDRDREWF